jgi:hypothetical protein
MAMASSMTALDASGPPSPGDGGSGDSGTNSFTPEGSGYSVDFGTNLWIANFALSQGSTVGIVSNTAADISYEIQYKNNLTSTQWMSTGFFILGSELTNWTAMSIPGVSLTNNAFFRIRSWASSDGSGLPDWWELEYFNTTGVDPYGDPAGDGWNNLQKFQNGMNPNLFYTPPAPQGLTVNYNSTIATANISWLPSPGAVTGYTVEDSEGNTSNFPATTLSFVDNVSSDLPDPWNGNVISTTYRIQAHYTAGNSTWSAAVPLEQNPVSANIFPGPQGSTYYLGVSGLPANTATVRLIFIDWSAMAYHNDDSFNTNYDIPVSAFINGVYQFPVGWSPPDQDVYGYADYDVWVQAIGANGSKATPVRCFNYPQTYAFHDGRVQLKQNLIFLLRAGLVDFSFPMTAGIASGQLVWPSYAYPTDYVYSGLYELEFDETDQENNHVMRFVPLGPFENNYLWRNFVPGPTNLNAYGQINTGATSGSSNGKPIFYLNNPVYQFQLPSSDWTTVTAVLGTNDTQWLYSYPGGSLSEIGITYSSPNFTMASDARNIYGLPFLSVEIAYYDETSYGVATTTLSAGGSTTQSDHFYPETVQPQFQTVEYDFWQPDTDQLPGYALFSTTNTSRLCIASVASSIRIAGYAKLAVTNGYPGVYGYLGQYFDQAYQIAANGNVTTNTTGVLSQYGDFFATEAGPAALVTMPDVDTGARGTCTVYCASMVLDKNHDLKMDGSFSGPDATSQASPMVWWINDDYDYSGASWDLGHDVQPSWYYNDGYQRKIDSQRDCEDYARLWICGMPALTNGNYQVTLSWANVSSGSPTINLFNTVETNGGIGYLTNLDTASAQLAGADNFVFGGPGRAIATISPGQPFTFPASYFTNAGDKHFLFDGAITNGAGELLLTIADGNGNTIAQTGAWLDFHDVKDFYERAVITNNISGAISNWTSGVEIVQPATASALGDDTNIIVLVHGFNVGDDDWLFESDTVFKRLYWAGYRGKFMTVKWPCEPLTLWTAISENTSIFNNSEIKSYKAGTALKNYLSQLKSRFPNYRLNVLAHSQGNAIMGEAIEQGGPFDTYILTQGAMPASSYDVNALTDSTLLTAEALVHTPEWKPMGYHGVYTNMTGKIVSYYNPQDFVLNIWNADQAAGKPDSYANHVLSPLAPYYSYDGANGWWNGILYGLFSSYLVTDPQESRAMISRSRTQPVGRQNTGGVINSTIDLNAQFGFSDTTAEHSAEWTRPIQTCLPYYAQILNTIKP